MRTLPVEDDTKKNLISIQTNHFFFLYTHTGHPPGPTEAYIRWKTTRRRQNACRLQYPEGRNVTSSLTFTINQSIFSSHISTNHDIHTHSMRKQYAPPNDSSVYLKSVHSTLLLILIHSASATARNKR